MEPENPGVEMMKAAGEGFGKESANQIAKAISNFVPFWGLKKEAIRTYVDEIKKSNLSPEAKMMAIANAKQTFQKLQNQSAIASAACSVLINRHGENFTLPPVANSELLLRLLDSGKFVSDEDIQMLWGNVLAGELDNPGSTPKSVIRILSELDKEYACVFSNLCSLQVDMLVEFKYPDSKTCFEIIDTSPMIMPDVNYLTKLNITHDTLTELEHIGLINFASVGEYTKSFPVTYIHLVSEKRVITAFNKNGNFPTGLVFLTNAGQSISRFVPKHSNQRHMSAIKNISKWT